MPPPVSVQVDEWVYTDAIDNGWFDASSATVNFSAPSPVEDGSFSISVSAQPGGALNLNHAPFDSSGYSAISFWINGGPTGGQTLEMQALIGNVPQPPVSLATPTANTWQNVSVSLASLGVANQPNLNGFYIFNPTGATEPVFFVDDIRLTTLPPPAQAHLNVNVANVIRQAGSVGVNAAIWDGVFASATTISMLNDIGNQALRFPGGSAADTYHWATNTTTNGTVWATSFDTFAGVALATHASKVFITADYGSGTPTEAANWVTYSNVTHQYGFKYWEIGNELYGSWETDSNGRPNDPYTYATLFKQYFNQMKASDPTIKVGAVVVTGEDRYANYTDHPATNPRTMQVHNGWTPVMLATLSSLGVTPDFVVYHRYEQEPGTESDSYLLQAAETWANDAADLRQQLNDYLGGAAAGVEIDCTENNSVSYNVGKQTTSLVNGLFMADSVGRLLQTEFGALVWWDMRNYQDSTNNNSPLLYGWRQYGDYGLVDSADPAGVADHYPTYYVAKLLQHFARSGDQIVSASTDYPLLSIYAAKRQDGSLSLLVINKHPASTVAAMFSISGYVPSSNATVYAYGISQDLAAQTGIGPADVTQTNLMTAGATFPATFYPYSASVLSLVPASSIKKRPGQLTSQ
jgi:hypothetical protein